MSKFKNKRIRLVVNNEVGIDRLPADVEIGIPLQGTTGYRLDFLGAVIGDDDGPLANSGDRNAQRTGHIRSGFEMFKNVLLKHGAHETTVENEMQPQLIDSVLTSVEMNDLSTLAGRVKDALDALGENASWLAMKCGVSPQAVAKWLNGETKTLKADMYYAAAKALKVSSDWLRTGKGSRQSDARLQDENKAEEAIKLLAALHTPLAALISAIEEILPAQHHSKKAKRS